MNPKSNRQLGIVPAWRRAVQTTLVAALFALPMACNNATAPAPTPRGPAVPGRVEALATVGGKLYAGGEVGSGTAAGTGYVKSWDGTTWTELPGLDGGVSALIEFNGALLAGGDFLSKRVGHVRVISGAVRFRRVESVGR